MADAASKQKVGPLIRGHQTITMKANGAINLYDAVILITPGTGEDIPRVGTTTTAANRLAFGIVVGPQRNSGKAADAAGEVVEVHPFGTGFPEKYLVSGTVAQFDPLETSTTAGGLQAQTAVGHAGAYAAADADAMEKKSAAAVAVAAKAQVTTEKGVCTMTRGIVK